MKSYEKLGEPKKQHGPIGFQLVLQYLNQVTQQAVQFVHNGVQRVKEFTQAATPSTPDNDSCWSEIDEERIAETDCDAKSSPQNCKHKSGKRTKESKESSSSDKESSKKCNGRKDALFFNQYKKTRSSHVSWGRGALRVLLIFCVICSRIEVCTATGNDRFSPTTPSHSLIVLLAALLVCAWLRARMALQWVHVEWSSPVTLKPVFDRPKRSHRRPSSEVVYAKPNRHPSQSGQVQLLPGVQSASLLAYGTADHASNSYVANVGLETPEHPLYPLLHRLLDPLHPDVPAVMAVGDPTPEVGVRNPQVLHRFSEMVIGGGGSSPDPQRGSTRCRGIGRRSLSRTVSFPYEDSDVRSFNADALESDSNGEILEDESVLPLGSGWSQRMNEQVSVDAEGSLEEKEEFVCHPFIASDSDDDAI